MQRVVRLKRQAKLLGYMTGHTLGPFESKPPDARGFRWYQAFCKSCGCQAWVTPDAPFGERIGGIVTTHACKTSVKRSGCNIAEGG